MKARQFNIKSPGFLLFCIISLGLSLRLVNILSPILDLYPIRQEYCAMVARNFYRHGLNIFNPQVDWVGNLNSYWLAELPLISFLTACLYKIFGVREFLGRIVAVLFSVGSIYVFYKLVRFYFEEKTSLCSAFFYAVLPLGVYFGRTFMPESQMIFFSLAVLYLLSLWTQDGRTVTFIWATVVFAMTLLTKVSAIYILAPACFLFYLRFKRQFLFRPHFWVFLVASVVPALLWYSRSNILGMNTAILDHGNIIFFTKPEFYLRIATSLSLLVLTPVGLILFPAGFLSKAGEKREYFFYIWIFAVCIYILLYPKLNFTHFYYQLPLVPVCSVFMGKGLSKSKISKGGALFLLALTLVFSFLVIRPFYKWSRATYEGALFIDKNTPKDSIIIAGRCSQEAPLYYCNRKGWVINEFGKLSYVYGWSHLDEALKNFPRLEETDLVKYLVNKEGADYYFAANLKAFNDNPGVVKYLRGNFPVIRETDKYVIFKLN